MSRGRGVGRPLGHALFAVLLGLLPAAASSDEGLGRVISIDGDVFAEAPDGDPRRLRCRDTVRRGETVTTTVGGRLAVLVGDVYTRIGDASEVRFDETDAGAPDLHVSRGRLHLIDARVGDSHPPVRVTTPELRAEATGADSEVWVADSGSFPGTALCEQAGELRAVLATGESLVTTAGQCSEVSSLGGFRKQPRELAPLGGAGDPCDELPIPVAGPTHTPPPPSTPLPGLFPDPSPVPDPPRGPCEIPGVGCGSIAVAPNPQPAPPGPPVVEQPVVGCTIPGLCGPGL
ncbi:MAG: hypothetical protein ABFS46_09520 [Myxococcota bacterium]